MPHFALFMVMLSLVLFFVETTAYLTFMKWYYRLGPAFRQARWQLRGDVASVCTAIDDALQIPKLKSKRRGDWFFFRFRWWDASIWSRATLHAEPTSHGTAITYEFRPFISPACVALSIMLLFDIQVFRLFAIGYLLLVTAMYAVGLWWDLRKMNSLAPIRKELSQLGLSVCAKCGYDRFGLTAHSSCPECGAAAASAPN